jgi:ribulose-phosphate 3-epimerase
VRNRNLEIAPSILAADFRRLEHEVKAAEAAGADRIHCDIMDGVFVPNISFGPMVVAAVKKCVAIPLDVHLMIMEPHKYVTAFCDAGADNLTVHADGCTNLPDTLDAIRRGGIQTGVAINPDKEISLFEKYLDRLDLVLIMSVHAGFGGQVFMAETLDKVAALVKLREERGLGFAIEIDGGINAETAAISVAAGVDVLVAGSYVFGSDDYRAAIGRLRAQDGKSGA